MLAQIVNNRVRKFIFCIQVSSQRCNWVGGGGQRKNIVTLSKCLDKLFALKRKIQTSFNRKQIMKKGKMF